MTSLSDDIQADIIEALYGNVSSCGFWQTRDLHLSLSTLYLLSPRLCFFIVLKRDLFVYCDGSLTRLSRTTNNFFCTTSETEGEVGHVKLV